MTFVRLLCCIVFCLSFPALADLDKADGGQSKWNEAELRTLRSLSLSNLQAEPASPSNRVAYDATAQQFGKSIFFDKRFSENGQIACASCHQPENYFTDGLKRGKGLAGSSRNTQTIVGVAWNRWFYWDGRRDSLWAQALIPFEAENEMGSNRAHVVWQVGQDKTYRAQYESLFGAYPKALLTKDKPPNAGKFGSPKTQDNWHRLSEQTRLQINIVFSNIGKAIAAYERTLAPQETRFDRYVNQVLGESKDNDGSSPAVEITEQEQAGIALFLDQNKTQCMQCHNGPLLTNHSFHNVGSGNFKGPTFDFGRALGLEAVLIDEFNCLGDYSDAYPDDCKALRFLKKDQQHVPLDGAFKTPSLRNLGASSPYFHDGRFDSLNQVLAHYDKPPTQNGGHELKPMGLTGDEFDALVAFLEMLNER